MNKREAVVISAYTGILISDVDDLFKYFEELKGRPVFTHEVNKEFVEEIKELCKPELLEIYQSITED